MTQIKLLAFVLVLAPSGRVTTTLHLFPCCRYPTNAKYVQAAKTLIVKYPFLKDLEGNGYVSESAKLSVSLTIEILYAC